MAFGSGYVVGWGTLALINAGLAQGKGRSGTAWLLASLLLGPIATFLIVALDRPVAVPSQQRESLVRPLAAILLVVILFAVFVGLR